MDTSKNFKENLGIDETKAIPADYQIPYFVHQDDMNRLDQSHKRIEKWLIVVCIVIFIAFVGTNAWWMYYENSMEDIVTETYTAETDDGGTAIANGDGSIEINGESNLHKN